jgi:PTS system ascorbate-specific IIB component
MGLGSSMLVSMNVEKILKKMGKSGIEVIHSTLADAQANVADLFVFGADLADFAKHLPHVIFLDNIVNLPELETKMIAFFEENNVE